MYLFDKRFIRWSVVYFYPKSYILVWSVFLFVIKIVNIQAADSHIKK